MSDRDSDEDFVAHRFELLDAVPAPDIWSAVAGGHQPAELLQRSRRIVVVTSAAAVIVLVFTLGWLVGRQNVAVAPTSSNMPDVATATSVSSTTTIQDVAGTTIPFETTEAPVQAPPSSSGTSPATPATSTASPEPARIVRPYVDPSICEIAVARGPFEPWTLDEVLPFAMSRESPRSMQVIADPNVGYSGGFVLVQRFVETEFNRYDGFYGGDTLADLDGKITNGHTSPSGYGDAYVLFPDGTEAYLRARGLDDATLEEVIAGIEPRQGERAATGFDYDPTVGPAGLELLHEGDNRDLHAYGGGRSECRTPTEPSWLYRIDSFDADPIYEAVWILDRPVPVEVAERNGMVITIDGPDEPGRPTVDDVTNAPPEMWAELLTRPTATEDAYYEADVAAFPDARARIRAAIDRAGFEIGTSGEPGPRSESYEITAVDSGDVFELDASHQFPEIFGEYTQFESELNGAPGVHLIRRGDRVAAWAWCSGPTLEISSPATASDGGVAALLDALDLILREMQCADPALLQPE